MSKRSVYDEYSVIVGGEVVGLFEAAWSCDRSAATVADVELSSEF